MSHTDALYHSEENPPIPILYPKLSNHTFHIIHYSFNPYLTRICQWQLIKVSYRQNKSVLQKLTVELQDQVLSLNQNEQLSLNL